MGRKTWFEAVLENGYDPHHPASADRTVQQAGGQIRNHPGLGPAQHDAARPGAASGNRGADPEQQGRLPPSPRVRVSRRSRKRTWAWSRIYSSPACRAPAAVSNRPHGSTAAKDSTTRKDIYEREPTGNRWASGGRQHRGLDDASVSSRPARREAPGLGSGRGPEADEGAVRGPHEAPGEPRRCSSKARPR